MIMKKQKITTIGTRNFTRYILNKQVISAVTGGINDLDNDDEDEDVRHNLTQPRICIVPNEKRK